MAPTTIFSGDVVTVPTQKQTLITVIITHYNYSEIVANALASVARQSHSDFECIVVDDCSSQAHLLGLRSKLEILSDKRFKLIELAENKGQTNAIFEGLRQSTGEFVSLLDPDDLYAPEFLERMLRCHLNPVVYAAVVGCDMGLYRVGGSILTRGYVNFKHQAIKNGTLPRSEASLIDFGFSAYYPPETTGWLWATTSSLMFRRDALEALRQEQYMPNLKICGDTYCVTGCHMLGGTLFLDEVICWRGVHTGNAVEAFGVISSEQRRHQLSFEDNSKKIRYFAMQTLLKNHNASFLPNQTLSRVLRAHFSDDEFNQLLSESSESLKLVLA